MPAEEEVFAFVRGNLYFFIAVLFLKRYTRTIKLNGYWENVVKKPVVRLDFPAGFNRIKGPGRQTGQPANPVSVKTLRKEERP